MLNRRDLLKILTAGATTLQLTAAGPDKPYFFTPEEFTLLDTLTEIVIPKDAHSPGAHEAKVALYIDRRVAEAIMPDEKTSWRKGLAAINDLSQSMNQVSFFRSSKEQQLALMTRIAAAEKNPKTDGERFFTQLKETTAVTYYTSYIGIHQETRYKGNVLLQQFVGYDAS